MLNYQIALTNVPFDNAYTNVRYFRTRQEQEGYFNVNTLFINSISVNFNVGNLLKTTLTINAEEEHLNRLLSCNYLIVKNNSKVKDLNYFYYFITNSFQLSGNQISVDVELDVINTYLLDIEFTDCLIKRGHLNRFIDNKNGTVSFDGSINSKLFEREPIQNVSKRMKNKKSLKILTDTTVNSPLQKWLNEYVAGWVYYFISDPEKRKIYNNTTQVDAGNTIRTPGYVINGTTTNRFAPLGVICCPIYKNGGEIKVKNTFMTTVSIDIADNIDEFRANNNDNTYVFAAKLSYIPPFETKVINPSYYSILGSRLTFGGDYEDTGLNDYSINFGSFENCVAMQTQSAVSNVAWGNFVLYFTGQELETEPYETSEKFTFSKTEIINSNKNIKFNPKLLNSDYHSIKIVDNTEEGFEYDLQKINLKKFSIIHNEPIVPDVSRGYARLKIDSYCYPASIQKALVGTIISNDQSLMVDNNKLQEMLANNKNYYLQTGLKLGSAFIGGAISTGIGAAEMVATGGAMGSGAAMGGGAAMLGSVLTAVDKSLTIGNMKNAPDTIKGALGSAPFNASYNDYGLSIEEYDILENEKEMINDFMCQYGFTVNRLENIKDYLDIRKYYNYVQAEIEEIKSNKTLISNQVKNKFVEIFKNGIRFWNTDTYSYEKENYEKWLEA